MATATAVTLAGRGKKVLLISTDPAHSLSDSLETEIGGEVKNMMKNLFAVEIDPRKSMDDYKAKIMPKIEGMNVLKGLGLGDTFDMMGMTPGIDEMAAMDKFMLYMRSKEYDVIIFDTAPTGHTLRFLSLPEVMDSWVGKMIMVRMRFSGMIGAFKKILPFTKDEDSDDMGLEQLQEMKVRMEEARKTMSDPEKTLYNLVMIPEEMSILESERTLPVLRQYGINIGSVIVNQIIPANSKCSFCSEKRKQQMERLKMVEKKFSSFPIKHVELSKEEVKGMRMLKKIGNALEAKQ
ncbi:MAG: TRC40/GET3/ArsA family transport-energizing ATPase [Candidatus Aenigmarchaeota archaeon]|nr:TRC40/GET3/ArsA family transport-energizing ATPase [Candidatus Aenigmarchaeota archaeon]